MSNMRIASTPILVIVNFLVIEDICLCYCFTDGDVVV